MSTRELYHLILYFICAFFQSHATLVLAINKPELGKELAKGESFCKSSENMCERAMTCGTSGAAAAEFLKLHKDRIHEVGQGIQKELATAVRRAEAYESRKVYFRNKLDPLLQQIAELKGLKLRHLEEYQSLGDPTSFDSTQLTLLGFETSHNENVRNSKNRLEKSLAEIDAQLQSLESDLVSIRKLVASSAGTEALKDQILKIDQSLQSIEIAIRINNEIQAILKHPVKTITDTSHPEFANAIALTLVARAGMIQEMKLAGRSDKQITLRFHQDSVLVSEGDMEFAQFYFSDAQPINVDSASKFELREGLYVELMKTKDFQFPHAKFLEFPKFRDLILKQ